MAVRFPSLEFFQALQKRMQEERDRFRQLGYFDTTFGVRVRGDGSGAERCDDFVLSFEVFECTGARQVDDVSREAVDFILDGKLASWVEMLRNIRTHGAADTAHSINTLTHFGEGLKLVYDDPDGHDKLYRFAESIQEFFDLSSRIDVEFPPSTVGVHSGL
jgi:hypothetical protein